VTRLAVGQVAIRLYLFGTAAEELEATLHPPWPRWMESLHAIAGAGHEELDPDAGETSMAAALSAVAGHLRHRLKLASWAVAAMEELGWAPRVDGENVVMTRLLAPPAVLTELELAGILGPISKICELDAVTGMPRIFERSVP